MEEVRRESKFEIKVEMLDAIKFEMHDAIGQHEIKFEQVRQCVMTPSPATRDQRVLEAAWLLAETVE